MTDEMIASSIPWSETEQEMIGRVARLIIGDDPDGVMPPVEDALIIRSILEATLDFERPVRRGLAVLVELSAGRGGEFVRGLSDDELSALMNKEKPLGSLLRAMMQVVAQCYYRDERVLAALGLEARPPFPQGHELEDGDWQLLDAVRSRSGDASTG